MVPKAEPTKGAEGPTVSLHHAQLMIEAGREDEALAFYGELLGLPHAERPADMPNPRGLWFQLGAQQLHLGVLDRTVEPEKRAHICLMFEDVSVPLASLTKGAVEVSETNRVGGLRRFHFRDPFGNRLELMGV